MAGRTILTFLGLAMLSASLAAPLSAQLGLPQVSLPPTGTVVDPVTGQVLDQVEDLADGAVRRAAGLADLRTKRLDRLVRNNRDSIEFDVQGAPARRGELLLIDASEGALAVARSMGFTIRDSQAIDGLGIAVIRIAVPAKMELAAAQRQLAQALPDTEIGADNLHFQSGAGNPLPLVVRSAAAGMTATPVGIIDGGAGEGLAATAQRGFAEGAPRASDHASSVVSLLRYAGANNLRLADVYGSDPAGGNALAIARALGWLAQSGSKVINISLVGPANPLVEKAIARVQEAGIVVVAAVGNDGPAAPPAYPASYEGVLAVTAVDRRNRPLIEAGRASHLDYAAPGADIYGRSVRGGMIRLRGTSFSAPLVTARLAAALDRGADWRTRLDAEAQDLGKLGADAVFGRGLLCGSCRPGK